MSETSSTKPPGLAVPPLRIFVLWHPGAKPLQDGKDGSWGLANLAEEIVSLFNGVGAEAQEGLRIRVDLRSPAFPGRGPLPREIESGTADQTLIVVLIEDCMVPDKKWKCWIQELSKRPGFVIYPVGISANAPNFGWKPPQMPRLYKEPVARWAELLKRRLAIFCLKLLGNRPPYLFVSYHGESFGKAIGEDIYAAIQNNYDGLGCFFAPRSIDDGQAIDHTIKEAIPKASAMISILTSRYGNRIWCRQEMAAARTPRSAATNHMIWESTPVVVIDALEGYCSGIMGEMTGCSIFRWNAPSAREGEKSESKSERLERTALACKVIDLALTEAVFAAYHRLCAIKLMDESRHVITWLPDVASLAFLLPHLMEVKVSKRCTVFYPGYGLIAESQSLLERCFPGATFRAYEEVTL